jgi:hypothetical protein
MASTYTSNNGIEKPSTGEQSGTWGDTTNINFDIIDRALNGVGAISLSGTTHTLSTSDGAVSEGDYKVLVLGGSPSGTNTITITPSDQQKSYLVHNNTSQSAVFTQGSGGNATIEAGAFSWIFADGAGAGAAVTKMTIDTASIEDGAITTAKLADTAVATAKISDSAVTSAKLADDSVTSVKILDDAVDTAKIADDAVTTAKIVDGAVTVAKLASNAVFASGTKMLFQQTTAPTGWTKDTTHNNKALRVVSGTASSGGTVAFTTAFDSQSVSGSISNTVSGSTAGHTLSVSEMPSHNHSITSTARRDGGSPPGGSFPHGSSFGTDTTLATVGLTLSIDNTGGGGSHSHGAGTLAVSSAFTGTSINMDVQYVDVIIAEKD